jgi:hypothetical protein
VGTNLSASGKVGYNFGAPSLNPTISDMASLPESQSTSPASRMFVRRKGVRI